MCFLIKTVLFFFRLQQQLTTSQPHHRSCSSGTGFELISIRGLMLQVWRRRLNSTPKMTQETVRTPTFQRDMWVTDTCFWHYRNNEWSESSRLVEIVTSQLKKYDKHRVLYTPPVMCKCLCNWWNAENYALVSRWTSCLLSTRLAVSASMRAMTVASITV